METRLYFDTLDDLFDKSDVFNVQVNVLNSSVKILFIWSCSITIFLILPYHYFLTEVLSFLVRENFAFSS